MKTLSQLTKETNHNTRFLYHLGYWDGPLSGMMLWEGERVYFSFDREVVTKIPFNEEESEEWKIICENSGYKYDENELYDQERQWFYKVYRLPKKLIKQIDKRHSAFKRYVGQHTDYDEDNKRPADKGKHKLRPYFLHRLFYCNFTKSPEVKKEIYEVIGEFER